MKTILFILIPFMSYCQTFLGLGTGINNSNGGKWIEVNSNLYTKTIYTGISFGKSAFYAPNEHSEGGVSNGYLIRNYPNRHYLSLEFFLHKDFNNLSVFIGSKINKHLENRKYFSKYYDFYYSISSIGISYHFLLDDVKIYPYISSVFYKTNDIINKELDKFGYSFGAILNINNINVTLNYYNNSNIVFKVQYYFQIKNNSVKCPF